VRNSAIHLVFAVLTLVLGAAAEELLPKPLGVGFPVLMVAVQFMAVRRPRLAMALFAIAAGAVEDAISSLPVMTGASFFLPLAVLARWTDLPRGVTLLGAPFFQLWLWIWVPGLQGNIFHRLLLALPVAGVTVLAVGALLAWAERGAALDEEG